MTHPNPFRRALTLSAAVVALTTPSLAFAKDGVKADEDGLTFKTGDVEFNLGGRLHLDATVFEHGLDSDTQADVRRARLEFAAKFGDLVQVRVDREFAQAKGWRNLWLQVTPVKNLDIRGGNQIVPFSMEDLSSSNDMTFAERSLANSFAPAFGLGGSATYSHDNFTIAGGYFENALDGEVGQARERGKGFAGRVTFAPINDRSGFVHLGAGYDNRSLSGTNAPRFSAVSASSLAPNLLSTGAIAGATDLVAYNAEFAAARGPVQVQAQYIATTIDRTALSSLDYSGWYAEASWMVTGERYGYSRGSGVPSGPRIGKNGGAIELAARYSEADLADAGLNAGRASIATLGATWYLNRNIRLLANYARTRTRGSLVTPDDTGNLGVVRFQIAF